MKFYFKIAETGFEPVFTAYETGLEPLQSTPQSSLRDSNPYCRRERAMSYSC